MISAFDGHAEPAALRHIERTLAASYHAEIEQDENVWRSLPFFAATLAVQLAALFQLVDRLPPPTGWAGLTALALLVLSAATSVVALCFLAASIYPASLSFITPETELLEYCRRLIDEERHPANLAQPEPFSALITLKAVLAKQYAIATEHNRRINLRRKRRRSIAGLAIVASVFLTLLLVGATFAHYIPIEFEKGADHGSIRPVALPDPRGTASSGR